jgi:hypothetical protein
LKNIGCVLRAAQRKYPERAAAQSIIASRNAAQRARGRVKPTISLKQKTKATKQNRRAFGPAACLENFRRA